MTTTKLTTKTLFPQHLINACIEGKRAAQEALYEKFAPTMFGICLRYASDYHTAEDLLQDGFVKAFYNIDQFNGKGSFEGWLKRIFINTAIEHFRKSKKMSFFPIQQEQLLQTTQTNVIDQLAVDDLLNVLQQSPPGYRAVFNLFVIEGYSHKEISQLLGISEGTSKSQLARARVYLQNLIQQLEQTNGQ